MARYAAVLLAFLLIGCSGIQDQPGVGGVNPAEYCRAVGAVEGTEGFSNCVSNYIHQLCMEQGLDPGTQEYATCERNLREATFLRQQLQIRGF
jgi:hypothetical protein